MNPRDVQNAMKRMGIKQVEIDAKEVLIRTSGKTILISNPSVAKVDMMGQVSYQISGAASEIDEEPESYEPTDEDISMVVSQANCSQEEAKKALLESGGDIAAAILA